MDLDTLASVATKAITLLFLWKAVSDFGWRIVVVVCVATFALIAVIMSLTSGWPATAAVLTVVVILGGAGRLLRARRVAKR